MSDTPGGVGWWQASDGKWYPPHTHPDYRPPEPAAPQAAPPYGTPPGPQPSAYAPYGYGTYPTPPQTSSKATAALVLSIVSFVVCPFIAAIAALVLASQGAKEIRESDGRMTGEGMVTAGRIIAIVNIVLSILFAGFVALAVVAFDDNVEEFGRGFGDGITQTELEEALRLEQQFFSENDRYTDSAFELAQMDASITFVPGTQPVNEGVVVVAAGERQVTLGARSTSGTCFYIRDQLGTTTYAEDDFCGDFAAQVFTSSW